ncbi:STAS domain-containing protein [Actinocrispum sp. NPDC049592]|uniref:STAS domain-containing protein n=1 Tax=Actinocrispum sp. NPDC049592 TaxID=3154835 RepID=UPI00344721F2
MAPTSPIIQVSGEIDLATQDAMADQIFARLEHRPESLVIDLSGVQFIDSTGISVLIRAFQAAQKIPTRLRIVVNTPPVTNPLRLTGLTEYLPLSASVAEAMDFLNG